MIFNRSIQEAQMIRKLLIFALTSGLASRLYRSYRGKRIAQRMSESSSPTRDRAWNAPSSGERW
jgi:hypothetical protein